MKEAVNFLTAFAQALSTANLYPPGHPARERAQDAAYQALLDLQSARPRAVLTFLGDEIICDSQPLRELPTWDWGKRLAEAGVQRLEFEPGVGPEEFEGFVADVLARLTALPGSTAEVRQMADRRIRFGTVGIKGEDTTTETPMAIAAFSLADEAEAVRWLHTQVQRSRVLHLTEAEAVVAALSVAMHSERQILVPLLRMRSFDEYTTTHSMNVSVLAMAFAEFLGLGPRDVRAFGVAGLLHDIGKVSIPIEILTKPGKLTDEERAIMNRHPSEGARVILDTGEAPDLAAVVAYEHHILLDGGGYPTMQFRRDCHFSSKVVHICDVYDALRTHRPYRQAWSADRVLSYIGERAGLEFEPDLATRFREMMLLSDLTVAAVDGDGGPPDPPPSSPTAADPPVGDTTPPKSP